MLRPKANERWSPGDWAIVSEDDAGNVFWDKIDNSSVDGAGTENNIAMWTSAKTLGNAAPVTMIQDPDPNVSTLTFSGGNKVVFDTAIELQQEVFDNGANAGTSNDILVSDSSSQLSYQNLSTIHVNSAEKLTQQVISNIERNAGRGSEGFGLPESCRERNRDEIERAHDAQRMGNCNRVRYFIHHFL